MPHAICNAAPRRTRERSSRSRARPRSLASVSDKLSPRERRSLSCIHNEPAARRRPSSEARAS
eukprot:3520797-Heterocapsa_arctica.AAC.1